MKPEQERAYIQQARADPRAFVHLYDHYFPRVHAYVCYRVHAQQDAEDLVADIFIKAMLEVGSFKWRHENSFSGWLFRIAHNLIIDYYRRCQQLQVNEIPFDPGEPPPDDAVRNGAVLANQALPPEEALNRQETFRQMRALVASLSPRRQEVITLKFFGGLRNKEIAGILDLDERTIASHLSRGLKDLRDKYAVQTASPVLEEVNV